MEKYKELLISKIETEIDTLTGDIAEGYQSSFSETFKQNIAYVHGLIDALEVTGYSVFKLRAKLQDL